MKRLAYAECGPEKNKSVWPGSSRMPSKNKSKFENIILGNRLICRPIGILHVCVNSVTLIVQSDREPRTNRKKFSLSKWNSSAWLSYFYLARNFRINVNYDARVAAMLVAIYVPHMNSTTNSFCLPNTLPLETRYWHKKMKYRCSIFPGSLHLSDCSMVAL